MNIRVGKPLEAEWPEPQMKHVYKVYQDHLQLGGSETNAWAPFKSKMDWEIAHWAKLHGPGSTAVLELLSTNSVRMLLAVIPTVYLLLGLPLQLKIQDMLGLSYKNSCELNKIIDSKLPSLPCFQWKQVKMGGKSFDIHF